MHSSVPECALHIRIGTIAQRRCSAGAADVGALLQQQQCNIQLPMQRRNCTRSDDSAAATTVQRACECMASSYLHPCKCDHAVVVSERCCGGEPIEIEKSDRSDFSKFKFQTFNGCYLPQY